MNPVYRSFTRLLIAVSLLSVVLLSCKNGELDQERSVENEEKRENREFPLTKVPLYITDQMEAATYVACHFWDNYFKEAKKDTSLYTIDAALFEKAYSNWISIINAFEKRRHNGTRQSGIEGIYQRISSSHKKIYALADSLYLAGHKTPLLRLIELSEKYLYHPNSPQLNEESYIPALEATIALKSLDSLNKMTYRYQLELASLNRIGRAANDFEYLYVKGREINAPLRKSSVYKTKANYLLIYFNNPDCNSCREETTILKENPLISALLENGELKILSMYIDEDVELWKKHHYESPELNNWIYARDGKFILRDNGLYGIRAIPSIYLLDKEKRVLLKDVNARQAVEFLQKIDNGTICF